MVHTKLQHVNVHRAWLYQEVQQRQLQVTWVPL
jgi:sRNA-binding carbon storage regulator CsrA